MSNTENPRQSKQEFQPEIRRARIERLTIYDVSEYELYILGRGSPDSIYLNFAIFLLSVAISLTTALLTTTITSVAVLVVFVVCIVVGYLGGIFLLILWYRNRSSIADVIETIRKRLPPEGIARPLLNVEGSGDERT